MPPGLTFIIPVGQELRKIDMRTKSIDIPPQEILTKDSVTVAVDAVVYYRINRPIDSVKNVSNASASTRLLAQTTLRNILGKLLIHFEFTATLKLQKHGFTAN